MPTHKVPGGYQWGEHGKVYKDKASADRQGKAAFANGYKGKGHKKGGLVETKEKTKKLKASTKKPDSKGPKKS